MTEWWHSGVAGGFSGLAQVLALHPLDVIKTRLQVQDGTAAASSRSSSSGGPHTPPYRGLRDAVRRIYGHEGVRGFYGGVGTALVGSVVSWGLYFCAYDRAKRLNGGGFGLGAGKGEGLGGGQQGALNHLVSAAEAGFLVTLGTNPIWVVKTRMQLQTYTKNRKGELKYRSAADAVTRILREEGVFAFYRGIIPSLLLISHGALQFMAYEEMKGQLLKNGSHADGVLSAAEITTISCVAKFFASLATYPTQVMRARLQQRQETPNKSLRYADAFTAVHSTWTREGIPGFYRGLLPNLVRVLPQSAITFLSYEYGMRALSLL